jgi:hypothetical protein
MRTAYIFRAEIMKGIANVMGLFANAELTEEARDDINIKSLMRIMRLEFVLNLLQHSYSVELLEIHSQSWMCEAMHLLEDSNPRWYVDISRQYVADLNRRFYEVATNPTVDNVRVIFTNLQEHFHHTIFCGILRLKSTWFNNTTKTMGLFNDFFFDMTPQFMPATWHDSPYPLIIIINDNRIRSNDPFAEYETYRRNKYWWITLQLLKKSMDAGVMVPPSVFLIGGVYHTLPLVDVFCLDSTWSSFLYWYRNVREVHVEIMRALRSPSPSSSSSSSSSSSVESGRRSPFPSSSSSSSVEWHFGNAN